MRILLLVGYDGVLGHAYTRVKNLARAGREQASRRSLTRQWSEPRRGRTGCPYRVRRRQQYERVLTPICVAGAPRRRRGCQSILRR